MVSWDLLDENWDSLGDWLESGAGEREIDPAGQLHHILTPYTEASYKILASGLPSKFTVEYYQAINAYSIHFCDVAFCNGVKVFNLLIWKNKIEVWTDAGFVSYDIENKLDVWYKWRLLCDVDSDELTVYRDDEFLKTFTDVRTNSLNDGYVQTRSWQNCEFHQDYIKIASGLHTPFYLHPFWRLKPLWGPPTLVKVCDYDNTQFYGTLLIGLEVRTFNGVKYAYSIPSGMGSWNQIWRFQIEACSLPESVCSLGYLMSGLAYNHNSIRWGAVFSTNQYVRIMTAGQQPTCAVLDYARPYYPHSMAYNGYYHKFYYATRWYDGESWKPAVGYTFSGIEVQPFGYYKALRYYLLASQKEKKHIFGANEGDKKLRKFDLTGLFEGQYIEDGEVINDVYPIDLSALGYTTIGRLAYDPSHVTPLGPQPVVWLIDGTSIYYVTLAGDPD